MDDRSKYLSLAQISQNVIDSMLRYIEHGDWDTLRMAVLEILGPLETISTKSRVAQTQQTTRGFGSYEFVSTLSEVWDKSEGREVIKGLKELLKVGDGIKARHQARKLIPHFQKLSTQALWNFEQPDAGLPRGVFELCKAP
jgi:hypothetical protein